MNKMSEPYSHAAPALQEVVLQLARVAAATADAPWATVEIYAGPGRAAQTVHHGARPSARPPAGPSAGPSAGPPMPFSVSIPVLAGGAQAGSLTIVDSAPRDGLTPVQQTALNDIAALIANHLVQTLEHAGLVQVAERAVRADRMLQVVTEASSCAAALTGLLKELCQHHHALVGRIWQLDPAAETMQELSRFNADDLDAQSYYRRPPAAPVNARNTITAEAIRSNEPQAVEYSTVRDPHRFVLLANARASGLASQISFPIWVQDQRFGISLAFPAVPDLHAIQDDIAALAHTIRPALLRKMAEERIRHIAHHDNLTQLSNRLVFHDRLAAAVAVAEQGDSGLALLSLDLDGFKAVNDRCGHEVGDKLLSAVASRIQESVRACDTVARVGGDEFAIVQSLEGQPASASSLAERLIKRMGVPFEVGPHRFTIGLSIGVAIYPPGDGITPEMLLQQADVALYRAKAAGRNTTRVFMPEMDVARQERALIERDLTDAVARHEFHLAFQPICDTETRAVRGFEALLRWDHPTRGPIDPAYFVHLAEQSGLILPLGQWALDAACTEAATWDPPVRLSVNLSPLQFSQTDLPDLVAATLARTGFSPHRLDLEVTEGLLLDHSGVVLATMGALKAQGIGITLDDFGTAYASLSYLRRFPFDRIKIDKSFIWGMGQDDGTLAIVQAIVALSARLDLSLVAEGVETEAELALLRTLGGLAVQGFLTGPPMTGEAARALLRERSAGLQEVEIAPLISL